LSSLCYGKILLLKKLKGSVLADYNYASDDIRLKASARSSKEQETFIHELGHRWFMKKSSKGQQIEIRRKWDGIASRWLTYEDLGIEDGDVIVKKGKSDKDDKRYKVLDAGSGVTQEGIVERLEPASERMLGKQYKIKAKVLLTDNFSIEGKRIKDVGYQDFVVSVYALKDPEEFFSELFSNWVMNKLKGDAKEWMDELI